MRKIQRENGKPYVISDETNHNRMKNPTTKTIAAPINPPKKLPKLRSKLGRSLNGSAPPQLGQTGADCAIGECPQCLQIPMVSLISAPDSYGYSA